MDGKIDEPSTTTQDGTDYLHISEETLLSLSHKSRLVICKLWKICLLSLYGGSKSQRLWCKNTYETVVKSILADNEGTMRDIQNGFDMQDLEYLAQEDFDKSAGDITSIFHEEKGLDGKYHIFAMDLVKLAISQGSYDARFRVTVKKFSSALQIEWDVIDKFEQSLVEELVKIKSEEEERGKERQNEQSKRNLKRAFFIGLTAVGGGAILALSAGLAAPLIGAGAVAVLGSGSAAIFTGASGLAVITSIFGAAGAGLAGYKMTKRIGKIEQFEFGSLSNGKHLHVTLAVSGFCGDDDNEAGFSTPWEALDNSTEQYFLKWEGKYLRKLGSSIIDFVKREAMQAAVKGILKYTALRAVLKSIAWPLTLISAANLIDNPWNVCTQRSKETGIQLAHVLLSRHQGYRPVSLIGFSLGARVIFYCLQTMLNQPDFQGIIEDVILIGAPVGVCTEEWEALDSVISGTLYNCYSRSDWLLKFVYRAASVQVGDIAGLGPISVSWPRLVNIDLTEKVNSHSDYAEPTVISDILELIGCRTKPVEAKLQSSTVKLPHEFVRDISRTPAKILPTNFTSASKEKLQQLDLTADEQETLNRLTSCQNTNVITSWKSKGGIWKAEDSDGNRSENSSPVKQAPWQKVIAITRRGSLPSDRKMLPAPKDVEWTIGNDDNIDTESNNTKGCTNRRSSDIERSSSDADSESQSAESKGQDSVVMTCDSYVDAKTVQILGDMRSGRDENLQVAEHHSDMKQHHCDKNIDEQDEKTREKCLVFINGVKTDFEEETAESHQDDGLIVSSNENKHLSLLPRTERSKSSGDIKADITQNFHVNVPGRGLFNKMRKNLKFTLPSPVLSRHRKNNIEKSDQESAEIDSDIEGPKESLPKKAGRKMSLPGSL